MNDPLSDFLAVLKVESMLSARLEARGEWAFRFPAYRHMKFGGLVEGERWVWVDGGLPVHMKAGDFYLLTNGQPYCIASDPEVPMVDGVAALTPVWVPNGVMHYGEGEPRSIAAAGRFVFADDEAAKLMAFLPPLIRIPADHPDSAKFSALLHLLVAETETQAPGMSSAASNLAGLVLVYILRAHLRVSDQQPNWLAAMCAPFIGRALSLMHERVGHHWTIKEIAGQVGLSRTAFAQLFREQVGMPPLAYLMQWRMILAKAALNAGERNLHDLAERLGYSSSTAFQIAFKRETGCSPGRFRSMARGGGDRS
ncbi:AraC family transcriptional regulator [Xanthomonas bonasiae]|uniref:AraC family transcriptional regulator n=1 Tax=Xanthomonas bonasiae TaxID=2810351 RepID=UPI001780A374|nr:AraC family transcriptional regulator [Xanthomonas surreyensis]MBD7922376.1 AraC family transcriptional regulator [Xanthomonas surreyensis]